MLETTLTKLANRIGFTYLTNTRKQKCLRCISIKVL